MSKQLYEEAIADVKKIKEIAEDNAKRAVIEAVAPRIRDLIEKELLGESSEEEAEGSKDDKILHDDELEEEFVVSLESQSEDDKNIAEDLSSSVDEVLDLDESQSFDNFESRLNYISEFINKFQELPSRITETKKYSAKIEQLLSMVDELHTFVQQEVADPAKKLSCNLKIKNCLNRLEKLQESTMKKNRLSEASINLELTGLPDEIDLESLGVNLVSDEGEEESEDTEESGDEMSMGSDEESTEEPSDDMSGSSDDEGALDLNDEEDSEDEEDESKKESRGLSDNVIVEIDENMLRTEIARMKKLRETAVPTTKGSKPSSDEFDDFGGANSEGEPIELTLREMDDDVLEIDMEEKEDRTSSSPGAKARKSYTQPNSQDDYVSEAEKSKDEAAKCESLRRRMRAEMKLQETLRKRARAASRMYEAAKARFSKAKNLLERKEISTRGSQHKAEYTALAKRYNESVKRFNNFSRALTETLRKVRSSNSSAKHVAAAAASQNQLRNKLAETNLINAKLMFTNKLLQSDALTSRQKAQVIAHLDEAKTLREVKLVYESLAKTLAVPRKPVNESRVIGSSSQATRSASPQTLNEGFEAERWAKLAGISK